MKLLTRTYIALGILATGIVALVLIDLLWLLPNLSSLRTTIDNDRASTLVVTDQQSNLAQLTKNLESIQTKQVELENYIWTFAKEDVFFSTIDSIAKTSGVSIDAPLIADATPSGTILPRQVTLVIHGKLGQALKAIHTLQAVTPIMAIQSMTVAAGQNKDDVQITILGTTLWK